MNRLLLFGMLVFFLAACAADDPAATVEAYLQAKVESDLEQLLQLSCVEWEHQAVIEASSFESMNAELVDMECTRSSENGQYTLVTCQGVITTVYNGETREWDLGAFPYRLLQEAGEWRMCGYQDTDSD